MLDRLAVWYQVRMTGRQQLPSEYWVDNTTEEKRIDDMYGGFLPPLKGRILDWGCSTGETTRELAALYPDCEVIGIDMQEHLIMLAKRRPAERVSFLVADGYKLEFPDGYFAGVFCNNNLLYAMTRVSLPRRKELLMSVTRLPEDGGYLCMAGGVVWGMTYDHLILQKKGASFQLFHETCNSWLVQGMIRKVKNALPSTARAAAT